MIYKRIVIYRPIKGWLLSFQRGISSPSSTKDQDLESVLTRNRRWIVNNQIKNLVLRFPNEEAPVNFIQKKLPSLGVRGNARKWLKKYPCCFELCEPDGGGGGGGGGGGEPYLRLTKRLKYLVEEEERVKDGQESVAVKRLTKLLLMSRNRRLSVMKLNNMRHSFGFPDDYLLRLTAKHPETFRITQHAGGRTSVEVELISWDPDLAVSSVEASAMAAGREPKFRCCIPLNWVKSVEKFDSFNRRPYVSPYSDARGLREGTEEMEKRAVGVVHELLTLTLWKKASIFKLGHFRWEFGLPERLNMLLLQHPAVFYVSNRYKVYTVVLRECFRGKEMVEKDPLVAVKEKFGELMQEGLHEYNQRHRAMNSEKKKKRTQVSRQDGGEGEGGNSGGGCNPNRGACGGLLCNPDERKRFYDALFEED